MTPRFQDLADPEQGRHVDFSRRMGPRELWSVVNQAPLYAGEYWIARWIKVADLLRSTLHVPGHVAEFGSWQGANLLLMAKLLRIFDPHSVKRVHAFDSFEGLQTYSAEDGAAEQYRSHYQGSHEHLLEVMDLFDLGREVTVHKGEIGSTLPRLLAENPALGFSFVYCDVDLYQPTATVLRAVDERVSVGGLIVLDEYGWDEFPGETLAADQFLHDRGADWQRIHLRETRQPTLALRKLR